MIIGKLKGIKLLSETKKLKLILNQIFQKHNLSKDHSKIVSDYLIKAELLGAPSHGLARLKMYCDRIKKN